MKTNVLIKQVGESVYDEPCWEEGEVGDEYKDEKMNTYFIFSW